MSDGFKKLESEFKTKTGRSARPASVQPDGSVSGGRCPRTVFVARPARLRPRRWSVRVGVAELFTRWRRSAFHLSDPVVLRGRGDLDGRRSQQGRTENCQNCLSHLVSPFFRALGCEANGLP